MNRRQIASILCLLLAFAPAAHAWTPFGGGYKQQVKAENIETDTTNFNGACSSTDTTVQACMDQLDDAVSGGFTSATITGKTLVTAASGDNLIIADASDGYNLKKVDAADFLAAGSGDVTAVGDCATGACFDGSSGTTLTFKNATSGTIAFQTVAGALGTRTISLPAETGTVCTTGSVCSGYQAAGSYLTAEVDGSTTNEIQNLFETISTTSGTSPVADSSTDTLTLTAGTAVTVTGDSATDAVTIGLDSTLSDIADGTIAEDLINTANPWADNEVSDTITVGASGSVNDSAIPAGITRDTEWDTEGEVQTAWGAVNILLETEIDASSELAGLMDDETGTGFLVFADDASMNLDGGNLEIPNSTSLPGTCTVGQIYMDTDATTGQRIYACESTNTWALQGDGGGGGGDSVSVDGVGVVDPNFASTGDIDFVDTSNTVTANITNDKVTEAKLKSVDAASDEDVLTYETTTGDFEWHSRDEIVGGISAGALPNDSVLEADLKAVDAASDEECLTYETTTGDFEWQTCGSGSGSTALNLPIYSAKLTGAFTVFTPPTADACSQGAQIDAGDGNWRLLFDATTDECATWQFVVPDNYSSTPALKIKYSMTSATANEVEFEGAIMCVTPGDSADIGTASFSNVAVCSDTVPGTAGYLDTCTITLTDDSCAAGDIAFVVVSKDADDATSDDATGDTEIVGIEFDYA